jgi:HlyD family secretion protein
MSTMSNDTTRTSTRAERRAAPKPARVPSGDRPTYSSDEGLSRSDVDTLLGTPGPRAWWRRPASWIGVALALLAAIGAFVWQAQQKANAAPTYTTEAVRRGNLSFAVTANGTLQPTRSVNIGSELSGTVARVLVDVNDRVKKGQLLVELDTAKLQAQTVRSRASLAAAQAKVAQTTATVKEAQGNLARLEEVARLSGGKVPSKAELDTGRAVLERAQAEAASARATVADARAALSTDETNLSKASIRSPIDGVVLTRTVEPGNAVAASLQAVTLFTIAEDLTKLRLQVNVDEADVGSVLVGQQATFTVSAYPSRRYPAIITRVAFGSTTTDNVVTYITYLDVDNTDLSLRPGMTVRSTITALERRDVLLVPNTALRFAPNAMRSAAAAASASGSGGTLVSKLVPRPVRGMGRRAGGARADSTNAGASRQLWVLREGQAVPMTVTTGVSDGRVTEVSGGELLPGMQVITDQSAGAT